MGNHLWRGAEELAGGEHYALEREQFVQRTVSNLNLLHDIFSNDLLVSGGARVRELKREYVIVSLYLLLNHLRQHYVFADDEKQFFYEFFPAFHDRWNNPDDTDADVLQFSAHRQQSVNDVVARHILMRQFFFDYAAERGVAIIAKDTQRAFSESQRIAVYRRDKGLCQECLGEGKPEREARVPWDEYDADHVRPHSRGGRTEISNARVLCRYHNRSRQT